VTRGFLVALSVASLSLPPSCAKLIGGSRATAATDEQPPPPPLPVTSATTPHVWSPPESPPQATGVVTPGPSASSQPAPSPDLVKARAAADTKDWKKVRALLEKKVKSGKGSADEAQLVSDACTAMKDKACVDAVKKASDTTR
jgi:hypothetical protein